MPKAGPDVPTRAESSEALIVAWRSNHGIDENNFGNALLGGTIAFATSAFAQLSKGVTGGAGDARAYGVEQFNRAHVDLDAIKSQKLSLMRGGNRRGIATWTRARRLTS